MLSCVVFFFSACGGGTSGTGGNLDVSGVLRTSGGAPLSGVQVSTVESVARAVPSQFAPKSVLVSVTDSAGRFSLALDSHQDTLSLFFRSESFATTLAVENIPDDSNSIDLILEYDEKGNVVEIERAVDDLDEDESGPDEPNE